MTSTRVRREIEQNLLPPELVATWSRQTQATFLSTLGDTQLLLIQIDDVESELAAGLAEASMEPGVPLKPSYDGLAYSTVMQESTQDAPMTIRPPRPSFDVTTLQTLLIRNRHFVLPLRRRATGRAFVEHVSVGRARNSDVVLRHDTVSKFHAWFECDDAGAFYLGDAKSKNGTRVNGTRIGGKSLTPVGSGDEIRFGRVSAVICAPDTFWRVLTGGA